MSVPERTGRACQSHGCRWCGQQVETVVYEVRDPETNGLGDEVMCCLCGKHQWRWGESTCARQAGEYTEKDRQWNRDAHDELLRDVFYWAWLAEQIIQTAAPLAPMSAQQAQWIRENVWPPSWLRHYTFLPGPFTDCACQKPPSVECQRGTHRACQHDGHSVPETAIQTHTLRAALFREPYEHRAPAGHHGRRTVYGANNVAWVWPAGTPCRETCSCACHQPGTPPPAAMQVQAGQLSLFEAVSG